MINNLKSALMKYYTGGVKAGDLSVCSVSTTNIVYLVFSKDSNKPDFAVRPLKELVDYNRFHQDIVMYEMLGQLVPEPIEILNFDGADYSLHRGIAGVPWFKVKYLYGRREDWEQLRGLSLKALLDFNETLLSSENMTVTFEINKVVPEVLASFSKCSPKIYQDYKVRFENLLTDLDDLDGLIFPKQHGDFCLNNLIFDRSSYTIIDFEDFGLFNIPCYDAITLARSLNDAQPSSSSRSLHSEIDDCLAALSMDRVLTRDQLDALHLLHLMCRLGYWSDIESRHPYKKRLERSLELYFE